MATTFKVGDWVGAGYWPNRESHPDHWGRPHFGQVLASADVRAWAGTPDFPGSNPDAGAIMTYVLKLQREGRLLDCVPVDWDFGVYRVVRWEALKDIRSTKDDIALMKAAKQKRLEEIRHPRRARRSLREYLPLELAHLVDA